MDIGWGMGGPDSGLLATQLGRHHCKMHFAYLVCICFNDMTAVFLRSAQSRTWQTRRTTYTTQMR